MTAYSGKAGHILIQMLKIEQRKFHQTRRGQSLEQIAAYFSVSPYLLARENGLQAPPAVGQILRIPDKRGNRYTVREGDTKELLCGSAERYFALNGTEVFYVGMKVMI